MDDPRNRFDRVTAAWNDVVDDMEATAAEYRERGLDVLEVHPGDVTALDGDGPSGRWGFDVLVPDDEFSEVERWVDEEGASFEACEVYRALADGVVYLVVAMLDREARGAILFPAYYDRSEAQARAMLDRARREGEMRTHLRTLGDDVVTFAQGDPDLFAPDG